MNEKQCTRCKVVKPCSEFYKDKKHRDGLSSWCKLCVRVAAAESKIKQILAEEAEYDKKRKKGE